MYLQLTDKGKRELEKYQDSTTEDLQKGRRLLMIPTLLTIDEASGRPVTSYDIAERNGLTEHSAKFLISHLYKQGLIQRIEPPVEDEKEYTSWIKYQYDQNREPRGPTKDEQKKAYQIAKERYPNLQKDTYSRRLEEIPHYKEDRNIYLKEWNSNHKEQIAAYKKIYYEKNKEKILANKKTAYWDKIQSKG